MRNLHPKTNQDFRVELSDDKINIMINLVSKKYGFLRFVGNIEKMNKMEVNG
jgi:hypothetical protein